jgi:hypothetical protein
MLAFLSKPFSKVLSKTCHYSLGRYGGDADLPIHVKRYDEITRVERQEFRILVETGAEVTAQGLPNRMKAAHLLGYVEQHDHLVAVRSLKHPAVSYSQKDLSVFRIRSRRFSRGIGMDFRYAGGAQDASGVMDFENALQLLQRTNFRDNAD